jgi:hypothetical protein
MILPAIVAIAVVVVALIVGAALLYKALSDSRADADQNFGTNPVGCATATCPLKSGKVTLVELVEVLTRGDEGVVTGAGAASGKLKTHASRGDKNGAAYKQYVNLDKDIEGAPKRRAEYARYIELKARVEVQGGLPATRNVKFTYELTKGKGRPAALTGNPAEGFGSAGGAADYTCATNAQGWTDTVKFYLSEYAGDQFKISAEAEQDPGNKKQTAAYEVWRKFWYQTTRATTHPVPAPAKSVTAYEKVCAEMVKADEVTFAKADAPASTFYPGWMVKSGGGDAEESVIGGHNREEFYKKFKAEADKPVKGHLIICQHQWDPVGESDLLTVNVNKSPSDELTLNLGGAWNAGLVTPALSGDLVVLGTWSRGADSGNLTAGDVQIVKGRSALNAVKVKLPAGAPDPTTGAVTVQLKLRYGKFYAGESNQHQMLIVYRGEEKNFTQVVSHEFGHGFGQTPREGTQPAPLPKHTKQYSNEHGGQGSHCSTDVTEVADTSVTSGKRYKGGTCIMFHQVNPEGCKQVFCDTCEPYLRLKDFSALS